MVLHKMTQMHSPAMTPWKISIWLWMVRLLTYELILMWTVCCPTCTKSWMTETWQCSMLFSLTTSQLIMLTDLLQNTEKKKKYPQYLLKYVALNATLYFSVTKDSIFCKPRMSVPVSRVRIISTTLRSVTSCIYRSQIMPPSSTLFVASAVSEWILWCLFNNNGNYSVLLLFITKIVHKAYYKH